MREPSVKQASGEGDRGLVSNPVAFALVYDRVQQYSPDYFRQEPFPNSTLLAYWASEKDYRLEIVDLWEALESGPGRNWPQWFAEHWLRLKKGPFFVALKAAL